MPLETGDFIPELDDNNPLGADNVSLGDDHMRLIKRCVTGSFPAFVGTAAVPKSVTKTEDQINDLAEKSAPQTISALWTFTGDISITGTTPLLSIKDDANVDASLFLQTAGNFIIRPGIGGSGNDMTYVNAAEEWRFAQGGDQLIRIVPQAAGSLVVYDTVGVQSPVVRSGGNAQTITSLMRFNVDMSLGNNFRLQGSNLADSNLINLARIDANDIARYGSAAGDTEIDAALQIDHQINGISVGLFVDRASGSLLASDGAGVFSAVAKVGAAESITELWTFTASIQMGNGVARSLNFRLLDTTVVSGVALTAANELVIGAGNIPEQQLIAGTRSRAIIDGVAVFHMVTQASGSALLQDLSGTLKKVGFRNPTPTTISSNTTVAQDDEGQVIRLGGAGGYDFDLIPLELGTTMRLLNVGTGTVDIVRNTLTTLNLFDGSGSLISTASIAIVAGSVAELYWQGANSVAVFGNGLTP